MVASLNGDTETTRVLLDHGANADYQNKVKKIVYHVQSRVHNVGGELEESIELTTYPV